ncbi:trafficking protein particle complex subunit 13 [Pycnococcus provasolii]
MATPPPPHPLMPAPAGSQQPPPPTHTQQQQQQQHLVAFRLVRQTRPKLAIAPPPPPSIYDLAPDLMHADLADALKDDDDSASSSASSSLAHYPFNGSLATTSSFGEVHLGETFTCAIEVSGSPLARSICVRVEMQTERNKQVLYDNNDSPFDNVGAPGAGAHEFVVSFPLRELGAHTLACSAVYSVQTQTDPAAPQPQQHGLPPAAAPDRRYFPQYYKFNVVSPLAVRTKCRRLPDVCGDALDARGGGPAWALEACLENTSKTSLVFRDIRLDAPEGATAARIGGEAEVIGDSAACLGAALVLAPGESAHVLHVVRRAADGDAHASSSGSLGKLDVRWRGVDGGESGRLQTQAVLSGSTASATAPGSDSSAAYGTWSLVSAAADIPRLLTAAGAPPPRAAVDEMIGVTKAARVGIPFDLRLELRGPSEAGPPPSTWRLVHLATAGAASGARVPPAALAPPAMLAASSSSGLSAVGEVPCPLAPLQAVDGQPGVYRLRQSIVALRAGVLRVEGLCVVAPLEEGGASLRACGGRVVCALVPLELRVV